MRLRWQQFLMALAVAAALFLAPAAQAGVATEAVESLIKMISKASGEVAEKLIKEATKKSPTVARLVEQYGDDAIITLSKHPQRIKIVESLGDDAAEAMLKHANIAEEALKLCPDKEVATALKTFSPATGQNLSICATKNALSSEGYKTVVLIAREGGEAAAEKMAKMPPSQLNKVLDTAKTAGIASAVVVVTTTAIYSDGPLEFAQNLYEGGLWILQHPILAVLIFMVIVALIAKFPLIALNIVLWLPKACWKLLTALWRLIRRKKTA